MLSSQQRMFAKSILSLFALFLIIHSQPPNFEHSWSRFTKQWIHEMQSNKIIGSSVAFIQSPTLQKLEFYGLADTSKPVNQHTIYHWASITKTFTGIAIMQLRDRGLLNLDDSVVRFIPELKEIYCEFGNISDITIRHLMSHSAGLRDASWLWGGDEPWHPFEPKHWYQLKAMFPYSKILFKPGDRFSYSNLGIIFLGRIIELLTGDDYEVYVDKNILKPLEMYSSYFDTTPYHLLKHRSNNFYVKNGVHVPNGLDFDTGITVSNGGLNAPIPDMLKYLHFLLGNDSRPEYKLILKRSSLEEMWNIQQPVKVDVPGLVTGKHIHMGLTFFSVERNGRNYICHMGDQKAFISHFIVQPETKTAAIMVFNTFGYDGEDPKTQDIQRKLAGLMIDIVFSEFNS